MNGYVRVRQVGGGYEWEFLACDRGAPANESAVRTRLAVGIAPTKAEAEKAADEFAFRWECGK